MPAVYELLVRPYEGMRLYTTATTTEEKKIKYHITYDEMTTTVTTKNFVE